MGDVMTIEKQIAAIERDIYWNSHVARQSKNKVQKERCIKRIDDFLLMLRELMDMKREMNEAALDRGSIEHSRWYDTGLELR